MLRPRRNEREVPWTQILPFLPAFGDDGAVAGGSVDDGVLWSMVVHGGGGVREGGHEGGADGRGEGGYGALVELGLVREGKGRCRILR